MSRETSLYEHFRKRFRQLGFNDFDITPDDRDALVMRIAETKPALVLVSSGFYSCSTPYMMGRLLKVFPGLNIAALSVYHKIPDDLAMWFIFYGVRSYLNLFEGYEEFYTGLKKIKNGEEYISPGVLACIEKRKEKPEPAAVLTPRQMEITRLLSNGFSGEEIAEVLNISRRTVETHKRELYLALNVRNENELIRTALFFGFINTGELDFYGGRYQLNPKPEKTMLLKGA